MFQLSFFENYEILGSLSHQMPLQNKAGSLFIEILNNYSNIKHRIEKSMSDLIELKDKNLIKNYLQSFIYSLTEITPNLQFFYDTIQFEFREISDNFSNTESRLAEQLNSITYTLENIDKQKADYDFLYQHKEYLENSLKNYTFEKAISNQFIYIDSLYHDFELTYDFMNDYRYNLQNQYYFKAFEIPREMISCVIKQDNKIRLLESKHNTLCGNVNDRNYIENKFNNDIKYLTSYQIEKASDIFEVYRKLIIEKNICVKKCSNCNNFFIAESRTDEKYCNNPSPQNPNKTCKEYGAKKTYRDEIKSIPIKYEHNKTSQFFRMRINRTSTDNTKEKEMYQKKFNTYKENYQKKKEQYQSGKLKEKDFIEWIIKQKEGVKNGSTRNNKK